MSLLNQPYEVKTNNISLKILIYGQPGLGKSTLALSMPKPVLIDCDNGVHRIQAAHRTPYLQVDNYKKIQALLASGELASFETIVFDTAGKLLDYMSAEVIARNPKNGRADGALAIQGYGVRKQMFVNLLKQVTLMGKHIVFVAHEKEEKSGDDKVIRPEIGGSSGGDLIKELDLVGYMEAHGKKRTISFFPTDKFYAKNSARIDDVLMIPELHKGEPNNYMERIVGQVKAAIAEETEGTAKYTALMISIRGQIESISNQTSANSTLKALTKADHMWDSKQKSWLLLQAKAKELGIEYSESERRFIGSKPDSEAMEAAEEEPEFNLTAQTIAVGE